MNSQHWTSISTPYIPHSTKAYHSTTQPNQQPIPRQRADIYSREPRDVPAGRERIWRPRLVGCPRQNCTLSLPPSCITSLPNTVQSVLLCAQNIDDIQGRGLLQSNASWPEPGAEMPASTSIGPLFGGENNRRFWHLTQYHKIRINT